MTKPFPTILGAVWLLASCSPCYAQRLFERGNGKVVFSPTDKVFAYLGGREVKVCDYRCKVKAKRSTLLAGKGEDGVYILDIAFAPDGRLALASKEGVLVWDPSGKNADATIAGSKGAGPRTIAFSPDGAALAEVTVGITTCHVSLWNLKDGKVIVKDVKEIHGFRVTFSSDGGRLAWSEPGKIVVWDINKRSLDSIKADPISSPAFSPKAEILAWGEEKRIVLRNPMTKELIDDLAFSVRAGGSHDGLLAFSRDGKRLAAGGSFSWEGGGRFGGLVVFDVESGVPTVLERNLFGYHHAFSPEGNLLVSYGPDETWFFYVGSGR